MAAAEKGMGKRKGGGGSAPPFFPTSRSPTLLDTFERGRPTILDKRPWDSTAIFIFFCHFSVPLKTVQPFGKFWIHASNIVCVVRGGAGPV